MLGPHQTHQAEPQGLGREGLCSQAAWLIRCRLEFENHCSHTDSSCSPSKPEAGLFLFFNVLLIMMLLRCLRAMFDEKTEQTNRIYEEHLEGVRPRRNPG